MARRHCGFVHRSHVPVAFLRVPGLRTFKSVDCPENWQPTLRIRGSNTGLVRRVYDKDSVELKADRARLNITNAGQKQRCKDVPIARPSLYPGGDFLQDPLSSGIFE